LALLSCAKGAHFIQTFIIICMYLSSPLPFTSLFRFYQTLKSYGIQAKRGEIVVAVAEKLNNVYPNLYRPEMYDE
jgi:hypothetical protein